MLGAHGAKDKPTEGDPIEQPGYAYVVDALKAGLGRVKKFIWCGDADGAGRILRDDMVRMLGAARFYFVKWPEGIKDANDMLIKDGLEALEDIYQLSALPEPAPMTLWYPGFDEWERKVRLAPRTLSVVTGHTRGHGRPRWFNVVKRYEVDLTDEERAAADARPTGQRWSGFSRRLRSSSRGPDRARRSL